jgi:ribosomal protein S18 acetylase RimI-like enzyme
VIDIRRHGTEVIDELRPLWLSMLHHHHDVGRELGPVRTDEDSWARRRAHYEDTLAREGSIALVAWDGDTPVGYATVVIEPNRSPNWPHPDRYADLDSLAVAADARGQGIGEALVARVQQEIEAQGITDLRLFAMAGNAPALRFYERLGFTPYMLELRREQGPGA